MKSTTRTLVCLLLLGIASNCESRAIRSGVLTNDDGAGSPAPPRRIQELASPSELAWQAWLLVDAQGGAQSNMDSASLLRRITPKSVFIAPALQACAEGYRADNMGRCVKNVNIDKDAHIDFLLQRLNAMYANRTPLPAALSNNNDNAPSKQTGPLQLSIPLFSAPSSGSQNSKDDHEDREDSLSVPVVVRPKEESHSKPEVPSTTTESQEDRDQEVQKEINRNGTSSNEQRDEESSSETTTTAPEEDNDEPLESDTRKANETSHESGTSEAPPPPTVYLLLSPTKLPGLASPASVEDVKLVRNGTTERVVVKVSNLASGNVTREEIVSLNLPGEISLHKRVPVVSSSSEATETTTISREEANDEDEEYPDDGFSTEEGSTIQPDKIARQTERSQEDFVTDGTTESEFRTTDAPSTWPTTWPTTLPNDDVTGFPEANETQEPDPEDYANEDIDEEYSDVTDFPDEESTEDEILKHGEAGMTIPTTEIPVRIRHGNKYRKNERTTEVDAASVNLDETAHAERDEAGSNVSSEVSIKDDVIIETTLLNVNKDKNASAALDRTKNANSKTNDESLEVAQTTTVAPEIVDSSSDEDDLESQEDKKNEPETSPSLAESLVYDPHPRPEKISITEIHTIDEKFAPNEDGFRRTTLPSRDDDFRPTPLTLRPPQDYVRFPASSRTSSGYVRFPSEDVNSIHNREYKPRPDYPYDGSYSSTSTKSSVPFYQKPSYFWVPPSWRTDRQQPSQYRNYGTSSGSKSKPMVLRFWTRVPLLRDPSLYPKENADRREDANDDRRDDGRYYHLRSPVSFYKEISAQEVNRVLGRKLASPVGG